MATKRSRFRIIPLRLENKEFASVGECSFDWTNGEYEFRLEDGSYINPFERLKTWVIENYETISGGSGGDESEGDDSESTYETTFGNENGITIGTGASSGSSEGILGEIFFGDGVTYDPSDYAVFFTPRNETLGKLGESWVEKSSDSFTIGVTGESSDEVTFDYLVVQLSKLSDYNASTFPLIVGKSTFQSIDGYTESTYQTISIPTQSDTNYYVIICPEDYASGDIGEIIVEKGLNYFKVINTGGTVSVGKTFNYMLLGSNANSISNKITFPITAGRNTLDLETGVKTVSISSASLDDDNYVALLQTIDDAGGSVGQIVLGTKTATSFEVINTGESDIGFDWIVFTEGETYLASGNGDGSYTYETTVEDEYGITVGTGTDIIPGDSDDVLGQVFFGDGVTYDPSDYAVFITPRNEATGTLGETWIEKESDSFSVALTGKTYDGVTFDYLIIQLSKLPTYNASSFPIIVGKSTFQSISGYDESTYQTISIPTQNDTNYYVIVCPEDYASGDIGEIIVEKGLDYFKVVNTGGSDSVGKAFNYMLLGSNINSLYNKASFPIIAGQDTFDYESGIKTVSITDGSFDDTDYVALLQTIGDAEGNVGQVALGTKTTTSFEVVNTGQTNIAFDWAVFAKGETFTVTVQGTGSGGSTGSGSSGGSSSSSGSSDSEGSTLKTWTEETVLPSVDTSESTISSSISGNGILTLTGDRTEDLERGKLIRFNDDDSYRCRVFGDPVYDGSVTTFEVWFDNAEITMPSTLTKMEISGLPAIATARTFELITDKNYTDEQMELLLTSYCYSGIIVEGE